LVIIHSKAFSNPKQSVAVTSNLSPESVMHYIQPSCLNACSMCIFNVYINTEYEVQRESRQ